MNEKAHGTITYSYCHMDDMTERPTVHGSDLWQVHFYMSDSYRFTWDVSNGSVYGVREEHYGKLPRRNYCGWTGKDMPKDTPLPIAL